ncbi:MAG: hypothetical protein FJY81_05530, partial [Candidatus Aminicenantes bacterium]|nr:hypothetical protein [Candidatus Aminicenantes bacterium]
MKKPARKTPEMNLSKIEAIFQKAEKEDRHFLLELEVYALLRACGIAAPRFLFLKKGQKVDRKKLSVLKSSEVVVKIVSPLIVHKSDVGGVVFVPAEAEKVNSVIRTMLREVPVRFSASQAEKTAPSALSEEEIQERLKGVLVLEKVSHEDGGFG